MKSAYQDGTTHVVMSALEFMQRLAALVPRPRLHLIRFHGVLAPHAKSRAAIGPRPAPPARNPCAEHAHHAHRSSARMSWVRLREARLRYRPRTRPDTRGGALKIIAAIEDPPVIAKILTHLNLPARAPPRSPARRLDLFQAA